MQTFCLTCVIGDTVNRRFNKIQQQVEVVTEMGNTNPNSQFEPSLFDYSDYREFLTAAITYKKNINPLFSFRAFSKKAGFSASTFLKYVMDGKRNLTPKSIKKVTKAFGFDSIETKFFEHLVNFNQATENDKKAEHARALLQSKAFRKQHPLQFAEFEYLSHWFNIVVRALTNFETFKDDPQWISRAVIPHISTSDSKNALKVLTDLEFIKKEAGKYSSSDKVIRAIGNVNKTALVHMHHSMIDLANKSIERFKSSERDISAMTIPISANQVDAFKNLIREFREKIGAEAGLTEKADRVYQFNMQFFPVAIDPKDDSDAEGK